MLDRLKNLISIRARGAKQCNENKFSVWVDSQFEFEAEEYLKSHYAIINKYIYNNLVFFEIEVKIC